MNKLFAGTAKAVITPPIGYPMDALLLRHGRSIGIHDDLYAKVLILHAGKTDVAIITMDVVGIDARLVEASRRAIKALVGIPPAHVLFSCSHNHTSPRSPDGELDLYEQNSCTQLEGYEKYWGILPDYLAGCVYSAHKNLKPARIGFGFTRADGLTSNRMHHQVPVDTEVGIIRVDDAMGRPIACLVNYQCHTLIAGGQYLDWTADWPGYLARQIEQAHSGVMCFYLQGACGNINPFDWWFGNQATKHQATYEEAERFAGQLAVIVGRTLPSIHPEPEAFLQAAQAHIILPKRAIPCSRSKIKAFLRKTLANNKSHNLEAWPEGETVATCAQHFPNDYRIAFAKRAHRLANSNRKHQAELQVIRINDYFLAANPAELFNELGQQIKNVVPGRVLVVGYTNGYVGYVPTRTVVDECENLSLEDSIDPLKNRWAYGASWPASWYAGEAGELIVAKTKGLIQRLAPADRRKHLRRN